MKWMQTIIAALLLILIVEGGFLIMKEPLFVTDERIAVSDNATSLRGAISGAAMSITNAASRTLTISSLSLNGRATISKVNTLNAKDEVSLPITMKSGDMVYFSMPQSDEFMMPVFVDVKTDDGIRQVRLVRADVTLPTDIADAIRNTERNTRH